MPELNGKINVVRDHITLDKEMVEALKHFIGDVWIMRKAQQCYDVLPHGEHLMNKIEMEQRVDETLAILVKSIE